MKKYITALLLVVTCLTSCYKDKGNDAYIELPEIKVEGIPNVIHLVRKVDRLVVTPRIISSTEGEIKADNPNFSFRYRLGYKGAGVYLGGVVDGKGQPWIDLKPANGFNLDMAPFDDDPTTFVCWFTVTDKRNNVVYSYLFDIQVTTLTAQGWLVMSHMGPEERVRLDMISHVSATRTELLYDLAEGLPQIHHGTQLSMIPDMYVQDEIAIFSKEGAYVLNRHTLESKPVKEFKKTTFLIPPPDDETIIASRTWVDRNNIHLYPNFNFAISDAGNVYVRRWPTYGLFGSPINKADIPQRSFRVAPFLGVGEMRPGVSSVAVFYDMDNKRFLQNSGNIHINDMKEIAIPAGSPNLFPYKTGKDMVYMEGTRRENGMINAILQDAQGKRSIYGMRVPSTGTTTAIQTTLIQDYYIPDVTAPGFEQATLFAFDSQFPFLFYAVGNKVYLYVLTTKTAIEMTNITGGEITTLKFNLWRMPRLDFMNNQSPAFLNQQFQLIVGTFDNSVPNGNGGKLTFYEVDGRTSTVKKLNEYGGFGKVKDVVYRERFK